MNSELNTRKRRSIAQLFLSGRARCTPLAFAFVILAAPVRIQAAADFSVNTSETDVVLPPSAHATVAVSVSFSNDFTGTVQLSATGLPLGVTASFDQTRLTASGSAVLSIATTPATPSGDSKIAITGTSGATWSSTTVRLRVTAGAAFSVSATPGYANILPGDKTSYKITVKARAGFNGVVNLATAGLPSGVTAEFAPARLTGGGTSVMTLMSAAAVPPGATDITVSASSGAVSQTAAATLMVLGSDSLTLAVLPARRSVVASRSADYEVRVTLPEVPPGDIALDVSGLPAGVTAAFRPETLGL